jgi:CRP/FNR family transcriptional regulator, cyclic AMP receptor protein
MRAPYGMNILDNCLTCPIRKDHLFCALDVPALQRLNDIKSTAIYPEAAVLFIEGQKPRGVFILCSGRVKLSTASKAGKTIITKISEPGDVLGLSASISNHAYEVTAEMIEPGQANFVSREDLLQFLRQNSEVALRIGQLLSLNYYNAHEEIRTLGMTRSPAQKLAKLLLSWYPATGTNGLAQIKLTFTHAEIADMIGTTRETVTRLFTDFTNKRLVERIGATLIFRNKPALAQMVAY